MPDQIKGRYRYNFHGLLLPLETGGADDISPLMLVKIIPELNQPFNTKNRAPFKFVCECIRYDEVSKQEQRIKKQDEVFNKSPRPEEEERKSKEIVKDSSKEDDLKQSINIMPSELEDSNDEDDEVSIGDDNDGWEKVSYEDLKMDGMNDPFANTTKKMTRDYSGLSEFAAKYESWMLKSMIIKANDDMRQEVLALQLMMQL